MRFLKFLRMDCISGKAARNLVIVKIIRLGRQSIGVMLHDAIYEEEL